MTKSSIRAHILSKRDRLNQQEQEKAAHAACDNFIRTINSQGHKVAVYWPIGSELDTMPLMDELNRKHVHLLLPSIIDKHSELVFRRYKPGDKLVPGAYHNIPEPLASTQTDTPTLIICPLVGCTKHGDRLGYGGGFYDRTIEKIGRKNLLLIGYCHHMQLCKSLPTLDHDQTLDYVITDHSVIQTNHET
tara:strand:- start:1636 stop:2205 length:570 start_codon:yes stop_codon:yes gene_type:complete